MFMSAQPLFPLWRVSEMTNGADGGSAPPDDTVNIKRIDQSLY